MNIPSWITLPLKFTELKQWIDAQRLGNQKELYDVAKRILSLFKKMDIPVSAIPKYLERDDIRLADLQSPTTLVEKLDEELIVKVCELFWIQREWLDSGSPNDYHKCIEDAYCLDTVFNTLKELASTFKDEFISVHFLKSIHTKLVPVDDHGVHDPVEVVIELPLCEFDNERSRYLWLYSGYWHYFKTRMMIKSIVHMAYTMKFHIVGKCIKDPQLSALGRTEFIPSAIQSVCGKRWYPEDFVGGQPFNEQCRDPDDAARVLSWIESHCPEFIETCKRIDG